MCTATLVSVHTYRPLLYQSHYFQIKPEGAAVLGTFFKSGCDVKVVIIFHFMGGGNFLRNMLITKCSTLLCWQHNGLECCEIQLANLFRVGASNINLAAAAQLIKTLVLHS